MDSPDLLSGLTLFIVLTIVGSVVLYLTRIDRQTQCLDLQLFWCASAVRFAMSVAIYVFGLVSVLKDEDATGWVSGRRYYYIWHWQNIGVSDLPSVLMGAFEWQNRGYGYMLGAVFYITDMPARLPAAALNCFFGAVTVILAYRIARILFSHWVAVRVGWWTCFCPSLIIWSAQTLKEPVIILLEMAALYGCIHLKRSRYSLRYVLLCVLAILLVIPFRFYAGYIAGAAVMLSLILPRKNTSKMRIAPGLAVAAIVISFMVFSGVMVKHESEFSTFDVKQIQAFRHNVAVGTGSGVETNYDMNTPGGFAMATLVGGVHLLLAPFPWQLGGGSLRMLLTCPELVVWWWLFFVGVIPGVWYAVRTRLNDVQPLLFFLFGLFVLYGMVFGNLGLVFRQRAQLMPLLLTFAAYGLECRKLRRQRMSKVVPTRQRLVNARG